MKLTCRSVKLSCREFCCRGGVIRCHGGVLYWHGEILNCHARVLAGLEGCPAGMHEVACFLPVNTTECRRSCSTVQMSCACVDLSPHIAGAPD